MEPDTDALRDLMETARLTPEALAMQTGLNVGTVRRTLEGQTSPHQTTRGLIADALGVPLLLLTRVVWPQTDISQEERQVHRRRLLQLAAGGSAAAAASLLPGIDPLEVSARVSRLVARYATANPGTMMNEAIGLLGTVLETLEARLAPEERDQLLSDAVDLASMAAWSATMSHRRPDAAAYFALAQQYAERSEDPFLKGAALASSARLDRPIAGNRPTAALRKLNTAIPLLGNTVTAQWAMALEAEACAAQKQPDQCQAALERINRMAVIDEGRGFFSSAGLLPGGFTQDDHDLWAGACYARLGRADSAIAHLGRPLGSEHKDIRTPSVINSDMALAYAVAREPEAACMHAVGALTGAQETGYRAGVVRVRQVRARLEDWAPLACVQELDERLLLVP